MTKGESKSANYCAKLWNTPCLLIGPGSSWLVISLDEDSCNCISWPRNVLEFQQNMVWFCHCMLYTLLYISPCRPGPGLETRAHFQITANEDVYDEDMQKTFPEYEWGPEILTHDQTNNEEINSLRWVFRLPIEIIYVHINLCSANLHKSCILTKTKFPSHCPHTRKDLHNLQKVS